MQNNNKLLLWLQFKRCIILSYFPFMTHTGCRAYHPTMVRTETSRAPCHCHLVHVLEWTQAVGNSAGIWKLPYVCLDSHVLCLSFTLHCFSFSFRVFIFFFISIDILFIICSIYAFEVIIFDLINNFIKICKTLKR